MTTEGHVANDRKAIPATCALHPGPMGFTNLMVNMREETIVLDPHVTGCCVITLDEAGAALITRPRCAVPITWPPICTP
jgi:hypothetical protein